MTVFSTDLPALPEAKVFTCSQCGECCSKVMVPIEQHLVEYLEPLPWVQQRFKALLGDKKGFDPYDQSHAIIPHRDDGYCVFLGDKNQCLIEEIEGITYKPTECQRFPFGSVYLAEESKPFIATKTPLTPYKNTLSVDGSVGCKTLAEGLFDRVLRWQPRDVEWYLEQPMEQLPKRVQLSRFKKMDWQPYEAWVEHLNRIVTSEEPLSSWGLLREAKRSLDQVYQPGQIVNMPELYSQSKSKSLSPYWDRGLCALLLRKPYGFLNTWAVWRDGHYMDIKVFGPKPIDLAGHSHITWPDELDAVVARFLVVILSRRLMLAYGHRLTDMLAMAIGTRALVHWYGKTLTLIQGKESVEREDALGAIRLVERYYTGHQPMFPESFRWRPGWGTWAQWLLK